MVALGSGLSAGARWRTAVLVNLAMVVEQANEQVRGGKGGGGGQEGGSRSMSR
jgi:hypothetical protein